MPEYRTKLNKDDGFRLVLRPGVDLPYRFVTLKAGIGNFWTISDIITNRWEIRPYQGVGWVWPRGRTNVDHLVRLEERFDFNTVTWNSVNSLRARYRLRLQVPFRSARPDRFWRVFGSGEFFLKLAGEEGLQREQFRAHFGVGTEFQPRCAGSALQATWQQEEFFLVPDNSADDLFFRFRVYQNF